MPQQNVDQAVRVGFFSTVAKADQAVRNLLAAGFSKDDLAVICPGHFRDQCPAGTSQAKEPGNNAVTGIMTGGLLGATLGGLALVATAIATGGAALLPAATVLIGGGAIAGGFGGLINADGYSKGVGEYHDQAIQLGKIVVGVEVEGEDSAAKLDLAERTLAESGAEFLEPAKSQGHINVS